MAYRNEEKAFDLMFKPDKQEAAREKVNFHIKAVQILNDYFPAGDSVHRDTSK